MSCLNDRMVQPRRQQERDKLKQLAPPPQLVFRVKAIHTKTR